MAAFSFQTPFLLLPAIFLLFPFFYPLTTTHRQYHLHDHTFFSSSSSYFVASNQKYYETPQISSSSSSSSSDIDQNPFNNELLSSPANTSDTTATTTTSTSGTATSTRNTSTTTNLPDFSTDHEEEFVSEAPLFNITNTSIPTASAATTTFIRERTSLDRIEEGLARARAAILEAVKFRNYSSQKHEDFIPTGSVYRNPYAFLQLRLSSTSLG